VLNARLDLLDRRSIEPRENDLSRELTALNRLPSIATIAW
jgi:hypothetical protein